MRKDSIWLSCAILSLWLGMAGCPSAPSSKDPTGEPPSDAKIDSPRIESQAPVHTKGAILPFPNKDTAEQPDYATHRLRSHQVQDSSSLLLVWMDISDLEQTRDLVRDSLENWVDTQLNQQRGFVIFMCDGSTPIMADNQAGLHEVFKFLNSEFPGIPHAKQAAEQTVNAWSKVLSKPAWELLVVKFVISGNLYNISREELLFPLHAALYKEDRPMQWTLFSEANLEPDSTTMEYLDQSIDFQQLKPSSSI